MLFLWVIVTAAFEGSYNSAAATHMKCLPFTNLSLAFGLAADNFIGQLLSGMNLMVLAAIAFCGLRWNWQKQPRRNDSVKKIGFVVAVWATFCCLNLWFHASPFEAAADMLNFTAMGWNQQLLGDNMPSCFLCCNSTATTVDGHDVTYRIVAVAGAESLHLSSLHMGEASCASPQKDGKGCASTMVSVGASVTVGTLVLTMEGQVDGGEVSLPLQNVALQPSNTSERIAISVTLSASCAPSGAGGASFTNLNVSSLELSGLELPSLAVEMWGMPVPDSVVQGSLRYMMPEAVESIRQMMVASMDAPDPLPILGVSFPALVRMVAAANTQAGVASCPVVGG